ncbi:hypothetical protein MCAP1_002422 [Malassezia caprae]|uniref:Sphingolipid delta(4)-desaturase n=1 Tax=Malassezia caprae TaxID=1381934 RepID=A0AAF0E9M1_9BASI|nr:hypothetical protein MCAP1_002422 [Malassezia caprae]
MPHVSEKPLPSDDFLWSLNEEPHKTRRVAILKAHPEVRKLMGHEPLTKYVATAVVCLQIVAAVTLTQLCISPLDWRFLLTAYILGGFCNQHLFLAIHEITHNLAFKSIAANRLMAIFANFPVGIPFAMTFKPYHIEHHKHLGEDGIDTDMPTKFEMLLLNNVLGKTFFAYVLSLTKSTFQLLFYALRPGFIRVQKLNGWHYINIAAQVTFDVLICYLCGSARPLYYFLMSAFFAGSLHPAAGHFIAEHYMFSNIEQETWSYYGPLNILLYNVGYHNEHHDFPSIPWTRLPALRELAPEFYNVLPYHTSWTMVILEFIFSKHSGMNMRVKRNPKFKQLAADTAPEDKPNYTGWEVRDTQAK